MSVYMTEEEQLETIKKWWQRYGNTITWCLTVVLLLIGAYRYYNWYHAKETQQASTAFERMITEFSNQNIKGVRSYANDLIKNHNHSVYADAAHMTMAKIYVSKDKLDKAANELQIVINQSKMSALKQIAKIRMARILTADKSYDKALNELNVVDDTVYLPVINELKGDIYSAKGQYQEAIKSYKLAMDEVKNKGMGNLFLEMKTNEIGMKS